MAHRGDILVIDDDAAIGDFIREALRDEGYTARVITDAADADAAIIACVPDLNLVRSAATGGVWSRSDSAYPANYPHRCIHRSYDRRYTRRTISGWPERGVLPV